MIEEALAEGFVCVSPPPSDIKVLPTPYLSGDIKDFNLVPSPLGFPPPQSEEKKLRRRKLVVSMLADMRQPLPLKGRLIGKVY